MDLSQDGLRNESSLYTVVLSQPRFQGVSVHLTPLKVKSKGVPQQAEVAQGVLGRLKPQIILTSRHYKGRQSNAPAAFTTGEIPGTHFQRLSRPQGTWFCGGYYGKKSLVTPPGIDPGTVRLVAQHLNHYATPSYTFTFS